jgi:hypothetical protein
VVRDYGQANPNRHRLGLGRPLSYTDMATTNNNCNNKNTLFMEREHPQYRETLSIALLSLGQARPLDVYYDGTCWGDAVKLFAVSIHTNP